MLVEPSIEYSELCVDQLAQAFNQAFADEKVVLQPGATEPFYQAAKSEDHKAVICSTYDYFSSALHEVAHWCIAGEKRRQQDDYGYWYEPDGRNAEQQALFYQVEARPQALEWAFSLAAGIPFRLSLDNLDNPEHPLDDKRMFRDRVYAELATYFEQGFPVRARRMITLLASLYRSQQPIQLPEKTSCLL